MTGFTVLDETHRNAGLRDRILGILDTVAPHVAQTTGLPLPAEIRYRLLTPNRWRTEHRHITRRVLDRDITDLKLTPQEISRTRKRVRTAGLIPVLTWPFTPTDTHQAADGQHETILTPTAWRHAGLLVDEPALHQVVTHALVHHLQAEARNSTVWKTFFPDKRGMSDVPHRSPAFVLEGHAHWADQQITRRLFGTPADHRHAPKSWRYRLHHSLPAIHRLGPSRAAYEKGTALIARAVEAHGTHVVNRVWKDISLLPTAEEIADPDVWVRRLWI
ncbi:zinc-dependent metalloprotease [Streptomyces sp. NPDC060006]|uniref:zinc-dependent metalloprotease n=1 Tax=unclassified Streptomyces TaxID=2593676 RepID=UPI0036CEA11F